MAMTCEGCAGAAKRVLGKMGGESAKLGGKLSKILDFE